MPHTRWPDMHCKCREYQHTNLCQLCFWWEMHCNWADLGHHKITDMSHAGDSQECCCHTYQNIRTASRLHKPLGPPGRLLSQYQRPWTARPTLSVACSMWPKNKISDRNTPAHCTSSHAFSRAFTSLQMNLSVVPTDHELLYSKLFICTTCPGADWRRPLLHWQ